jgi:hypothetical protein
MKLKFVDDATVAQAAIRGRKTFNWIAVVEELYAHPNKWVEIEEKVQFPTNAYRLRDKFAGIEVVCSGGNLHAITHPEKKQWTVYMRFVEPVEQELF